MRGLQEAVEKSNQEILFTKDAHKKEVQKLCDHIHLQAGQIKKMSLEIENKAEVEMEKLQKELTNCTSLMSEKNVVIRNLKSELKMFRQKTTYLGFTLCQWPNISLMI